MEEKNSKMLAEQQAEESEEGEIDLWAWLDITDIYIKNQRWLEHMQFIYLIDFNLMRH